MVCLTPGIAYSDKSGVRVIKANTSIMGSEYIIDADFDYRLSDKAIEALKNGVALSWIYQFKISERVNTVWSRTISEKNFHYRIQYHALTNTYRVRNENTGKIENFSTLQAALDLMSTLRDYPLIEKSKLAERSVYLVSIKISFERNELPLPLRPFAYINPQWYLSSDWYEWTLKK